MVERERKVLVICSLL